MKTEYLRCGGKNIVHIINKMLIYYVIAQKAWTLIIC